MQNKYLRIVVAGLSAGFISEGVLGGLFMSPFVQAVLYNPKIQSKLFLEITPARNVFISVLGLIVLGIAHSWFYTVFINSIPGRTWIKKGLFWGMAIWLMFWVSQEWFVYRTLLDEPVLLNLFELIILLAGSLIEGLIIATFFKKEL